MTILPRTRRGVWLTAAAAWLAGDAVIWVLLPAVPRASVSVPTSAKLWETVPDGRYAITNQYEWWAGPAKDRGPVRVWDFETGQSAAVFDIKTVIVGNRSSPDGRWHLVRSLAAGRERCHLLHVSRGADPRLYDVAELLPPPGVPGQRACFAPNGRRLALSHPDAENDTVYVVDLPPTGPVLLTTVHAKDFTFSADGSEMALLMNADSDGTNWYKIVDSTRGVALRVTRARDSGRLVGMSSDGSALVFFRTGVDGQASCELHCWGVDDRRLRWATATTFPDLYGQGRYFVADSADAPGMDGPSPRYWPRYYWWNFSVRKTEDFTVRSSNRLPRARDVRIAPNAGAFAFDTPGPDQPMPPIVQWLRDRFARITATSSVGEQTVVIDAAGGRELLNLPKCRTACWSPDGSRFVTLDNNGDLRLWDIPPGKSLAWLAAGAALWAVPIALLARRRVRHVASRVVA